MYGSSRGINRDLFVNWLYDFELDDDELYLLVGDFNFYRNSENRNKPGRNFNDILIFNVIIKKMELIELPLKGRSYTWSNMQA